MVIRSNPPGAAVYVDDNEVGLTPVAISPIYYGTRKIRLVKDGCETLTILQSVPAPWYEIPPLDFFSETLIPGKIRDVRTFDYQLYPQSVVPQEALLGRAENLRVGTRNATGLPTPGYCVSPATPNQIYMPAQGAQGSPAVGGQQLYQLPPGSPGTTAPNGQIYNPPQGFAPPGPGPFGQGSAPAYPPNSTPNFSSGTSNVGSQPNYALPSGG
jgi:PEGA domain